MVATYTAPTSRRVRIETDWQPESTFQRAVLAAEERIIDGTGGRRVGKSDVLAPWLTGVHAETLPGRKPWGAVWTPDGRFLYTAPQRDPNCLEFYEKLKESLHGLIADKNDTELWLKIRHNGAEIKCRSTERPDNLRGPGYDGVATDEKGTTPESAIHILRPTLSDPPIRCIRRWLRVGSARGKKHWTYREHLAGQPGQSIGNRGPRGHISFAFPTWSRPGPEIAEEVEHARRSLPDPVFRQEYGAEFLDQAAGYFDLIAEAHDGKPAPEGQEPGAVYCAGMDFGHVDDWNVVAIVQARPMPMRVVQVLRFGRCPWPVTKARGVAEFKKWDADATIDATPSGAPGEVITEAFKPEWSRVRGYDFREGGGREALLQNLSVMLSTCELRLPGLYKAPAFPILTAELDGFQYKIEANGRARGTKGPGLCDDTVMAVALAAWAAKFNVGATNYASRQVI